MSGVDFRVLRIGVWGVGLGVWGVEFRVSDLGCRISGRMGGLDVRFRVGKGGYRRAFVDEMHVSGWEVGLGGGLVFKAYTLVYH